jgi:hypothetical protein
MTLETDGEGTYKLDRRQSQPSDTDPNSASSLDASFEDPGGDSDKDTVRMDDSDAGDEEEEEFEQSVVEQGVEVEQEETSDEEEEEEDEEEGNPNEYRWQFSYKC